MAGSPFVQPGTLFEPHTHLVGAHRHDVGDLTLGVGPTSYTPGVGNAAVNSGITVGNGTEDAVFIRLGNWVQATYRLIFGSTTSFGGAISWSLPLPADFDQIGAQVMTRIRKVAKTGVLQTTLTGGGLLVDLDSDGNIIRIRPSVHIMPGQERVSLQLTAAESVTSGGSTFLPWNDQLEDTDNMWDAADPTRIFIRTAGHYILTSFVSFTNSDYTKVQYGILLNNAFWLSLVEDNGGPGGGRFLTLTWQGQLAVGDEVRARIHQINTSGTVESTAGGSVVPRISASRQAVPASAAEQSTVGSTHPFLWAEGDVFQCTATYLVASGY